MRWQLIIILFLILSGSSFALFAEEKLLAAETTSGGETGGSDFPYSAKIAVSLADVRSGPADVHYMTTQLKQGDTVEVYRHDPGGWLAIRPGKTEFSLVRAKFVVANFSKGIGRVTRDGVRSWIGTESTAASEPMWQIQFRKGDPVRLLGKQQIEDSSGALQSWYEIAPPAGEFRWIHESALKAEIVAAEGPTEKTVGTVAATNEKAEWNAPDDRPTAGVESDPIRESGDQSNTVAAAPLQPRPFQPVRLQPGADGSLFADRRPVQQMPNASTTESARTTVDPFESSEAKANTAEPAGWLVASINDDAGDDNTPGDKTPNKQTIATSAASVNVRDANVQDVDRSAVNHQSSNLIAMTTNEPNRLGAFESKPIDGYPGNHESGATLSGATLSGSTLSGSTFEDRLREVELGLTMSVLEPADRWQLKPYRDAVMQISRQATQAEQQQSVNALLEKIGDFEKLQKKHLALNSASRRTTVDKSRGDKSNTKKSQSTDAESEPKVTTKVDTEIKPASMIVGTNSGESGAAIGSGIENEQPGEQAKAPKASKSSKAGKPPSEPLDESVYAATGWLNRLYSNDGTGINGYVLQNKAGEILQTVLPTPGVKIDRYLTKEVGLIGRRGFNTRYNLPHVTADRVILLERHR